MISKNRRPWRRAAAAVVAVLLAAGCGLDEPTDSEGETGYAAEDCDTGDLAEYDRDCGYWQGATFVWWWWVNPVLGGVQPYGWTAPPLPSGASYTRPRGVTGAPVTSTQKAPAGAPAPRTVAPGAPRRVPGAPVPSGPVGNPTVRGGGPGGGKMPGTGESSRYTPPAPPRYVPPPPPAAPRYNPPPPPRVGR